MFRSSSALIRLGQYLIIVLLASITIWIASASGDHRIAYALPEYASRTGEPCATCHVNPGGGGPRTLRGLLWSARGKPDAVPQLPGILIAPGVSDGAELYDIACAGCHGRQGQGLFAISLVGIGVPERSIRSFVTRGIPLSGMPTFGGQFAESQLDALVTFVAGLASGEIAPPPDSYSLPPAQFKCSPASALVKCGVK